ncbi:MAG: efflux RND transporter permease subunit [Rhodobacteraceae bacterium]|jgi:multidrug efflux pump|nr:efflux RND transporter permease subunit [Paracoccaceae bacterium]
MTGIVDWAAARARMVLAFIVMSVAAGAVAYVGLPKEGEPDIEIPALFVSVPFPGISAADSERLLVKVMEAEFADLDGLKKMSGTAAEGYAGVVLEFEFGWDKGQTIADVRDKMSKAETRFPAGYERYSLNEINFSQFPVIIVALSGAVPERALLRVAKDLQERLESLEPVLEAGLAGQREEMLEVVIDPLRLEAYDVTASDLISVVVNNNRLVAAGEVENATGTFAVKIPASFRSPADVYGLPVKVDGDRMVTLGDIADIRLTFEDRRGTARFNGETTVALQVVKRKGFNLIDATELVRRTVAETAAGWPEELREAVTVSTALDQSTQVAAMIAQLEGSVLTAIALVMMVVLAALGTRSALLVGFAIPTSFLLTFALFAALGFTVSNIVMFALILAVGMLVDGAIVVVEYADRRIGEGQGPMRAYVEAAKRMFWPIVSSTATTLCAFLPLLLWPGVAGEFMGMLPLTLIFVLIAALVVALVYLPVMGGVSGRGSRILERASAALRQRLPWVVRAALAAGSVWLVFVGAMQSLNPGYLFGGTPPLAGPAAALPGLGLLLAGAVLTSVTIGAATLRLAPRRIRAGYRRTPFGRLIAGLTGNPVMPVVTVAAVAAFIAGTFVYYGQNNRGMEFFVPTEPEQAIVFVRARGNLSLAEKDVLVAAAEEIVLQTEGVASAFAFAGTGGLNSNLAGASAPLDTIGQVQFEMTPWEARRGDPALGGEAIVARLQARLDRLPGVRIEIMSQAQGPGASKPVHLRLKGDDFAALQAAAATVAGKFAATAGLTDIDDSRPLPGIDWQIDVDVQAAGRFGADVAAVGGMVQLVTRGILLDRMRPDGSEDEIEIRVRLPQEDRVLSTLDTLKVRTRDGQVPLSNFSTRTPVQKLARIDRVDQSRFLDVRADVAPGLVNEAGRPVNAAERIEHLSRWLAEEEPLPAGVTWEWTGDQADQQESTAFLGQAFAAALGLMFIILLAQFNSFYNATLVLLAVVLSTAGVLIGMLAMDQTFSVIMTGTGIMALAGIVVNNNIVLIDTYQDYARYMPRIEAIIRTAEDRIRPVFLTTVTTIAGLLPMMLGISLDFFAGGYTIDSPSAVWWKQLATAIVFGLGVATVLTLVLTPALLALRVWLAAGAYGTARLLARLALGRDSRAARDAALTRAARRQRGQEIIWEEALTPAAPVPGDARPGSAAVVPLRAAE